MPAATKTIEVWVVIDEDGDYETAPDEDTATERFNEGVGGDIGRRRVKITLTVPLPKPIELAGAVEAEPEPAGLRAV